MLLPFFNNYTSFITLQRIKTTTKKMAKKELQREKNEAFMAQKATEPHIKSLGGGVLYEIIASGEGERCPTPTSVVTLHYRGTLINGREFDNSYKRGCPEAMRVSDLIEGFSLVLQNMHTGDHWRVYIPWQMGYGKRSSGPIPAFSTLIFEIELIGIA
ncbi:MAG: FKBP-type peptidyl-prolyl cis-trans isomerase [Bacteroidaceae bacterium]|nr:FKBP-type peptidyl-prolyl cis-trans isomerase [Bacteroidaceae bacterium]